MAAVVRVTDTTARAELAALLADAKHLAAREFPRVGNSLCPTPWDRRHQRIDALLEDWERAGA